MRFGMTVLTVILIVLFFSIMIMVGQIQGTARIVNYAGLVRGGTQRMVKLENAGIRPAEPGFRKIKIQPYLPESMNSFTCSYRSAAGMITVKAERVDGKPVFQAEVPDGVEYEMDAEDL